MQFFKWGNDVFDVCCSHSEKGNRVLIEAGWIIGDILILHIIEGVLLLTETNTLVIISRSFYIIFDTLKLM